MSTNSYTHTYTLVLFEKDLDGIPRQEGQKAITKEQYNELCDPIFKSIGVGDLIWNITERRYFYRQDSVSVNFYIIIDAVRQVS